MSLLDPDAPDRGALRLESRSANFAWSSTPAELRADFACPNCGSQPFVLLDRIGELPIAECICRTCSASWQLELDGAQLSRLRVNPPAELQMAVLGP